jgi:glycosyltransferase involved in cell wall biosynthesis
MPSHNDVPDRDLLRRALEHVEALVLVDDGSEPSVAHALDEVAADAGVDLVRLPARSGKGSAVRAGVDHARTSHADAVLVIDADGQHPAHAIPYFLAAAHGAELVIGYRFGDLALMPAHRRAANRATRGLFQLVTGREVRDTQNGMRLIRGRALATMPTGGYEAEATHLRRALRDGLRSPGCLSRRSTGRSGARSERDETRCAWCGLWCGRSSYPRCNNSENDSQRRSCEHVAQVVDAQVHARQRYDRCDREQLPPEPRVEESDGDRSRERRCRMTRRQGRRRRHNADRVVERRIGNRRPRAVE